MLGGLEFNSVWIVALPYETVLLLRGLTLSFNLIWNHGPALSFKYNEFPLSREAS